MFQTPAMAEPEATAQAAWRSRACELGTGAEAMLYTAGKRLALKTAQPAGEINRPLSRQTVTLPCPAAAECRAAAAGCQRPMDPCRVQQREVGHVEQRGCIPSHATEDVSSQRQPRERRQKRPWGGDSLGRGWVGAAGQNLWHRPHNHAEADGPHPLQEGRQTMRSFLPNC